jgi:hypothetical protein
MTTLTFRRAAVAATTALALSTVASPASATDIDEDVAAAKLCPAGAEFLDAADTSSGDDVDAQLFTYSVNDSEDDPLTLCTFAVITTDEDSTLDGRYTVTVGGQTVTGTPSKDAFATQAVVSPATGSTSARLEASGQVTSTSLQKVTKSKKKAAKKTYAAAVKKAKSAYKKAGKTASAKKKMNKTISAAKKKYTAAIATKKIVTKTPYRLDVTLPLSTDDAE